MSRLGLVAKNTFAHQFPTMMKATRFLLLVWTVCSLQLLKAQAPAGHISMQEAVQAALTGNPAIRLSRLDEQIASSKYKQTQAFFLPRLGLSYTASTTNNPLNAFGFRLQQQGIEARDFDPSLLNHPGSTSDFSTRFELKQPLVNMDLWYLRKSAAKQAEISQLVSRRTREYLCFETRKAYLQLRLEYDRQQVLAEADSTAAAVLQLTGHYYNQGLVQKSDLLNAGVQLKDIEGQLMETGSRIRDISDRLGLLMGRETGVVYVTDSSGDVAADTSVGPHTENNRADLKALELGIQAYDLKIKSFHMQYLPRLNAFGSWQLNDDRMLGFGARAYFAGVQFSLNIFNGNLIRNSIAEHQFEKQKLVSALDSRKKELRAEISSTLRQINDASFAISRQQLAVEQAAEALRVLENRYASGLVKTTEILAAQTQLARQKLGYAEAVFSLNLSGAYLQLLTTTKL